MADGIIVAHQDRFSRENALATAEAWEEMKPVGCVFIACDGVDSRAEGIGASVRHPCRNRA